MKWPIVSRARYEREVSIALDARLEVVAEEREAYDRARADLDAEEQAHAATRAELERVRDKLARIDALMVPLLPCSACGVDYGEEHRLGCRVRMQSAPGEEAPRG